MMFKKLFLLDFPFLEHMSLEIRVSSIPVVVFIHIFVFQSIAFQKELFQVTFQKDNFFVQKEDKKILVMKIYPSIPPLDII